MSPRYGEVLCEHCQTNILKRPGRNRYCSIACAAEAKRRPIAERFWEIVDKRGPDECWPWTGARNAPGGELRYGQFSNSVGNKVTTRYAHRLAYELHHGTTIPAGMEIIHSCDNIICCNPAHLSLGTRKDNAADMVAKGRSLRGLRNPRGKLSDEDISAIRKAHAGGEQGKSIATRYGISRGHVSNIIHRKYRADVD